MVMTKVTKRIKALTMTGMIAALVSAAPAVAGTELETWQMGVGRSAPLVDGGYPLKPKGKCVCMFPGLQGYTGALRQTLYTGNDGFSRALVDCLIPAFDAAGSQSLYWACTNFIPLPK